MRELKFRAWDEKNNCWIKSQDIVMTIEGVVIPNPPFKLDSAFVKLVQFTGLKDKTGKEIYEGDIVKMSCWLERKKYTDTKKKDCEGIFFIKSYKSSFGFEFGFENISGYKCPTHLQMHKNNPFEVIGNIYENPELLERD